MWRVGRSLGRTLYKDDVFVGVVDTPKLAQEIVDKMNGRGAGEDAYMLQVSQGDALDYTVKRLGFRRNFSTEIGRYGWETDVELRERVLRALGLTE